jgi:hypothetical protein
VRSAAHTLDAPVRLVDHLGQAPRGQVGQLDGLEAGPQALDRVYRSGSTPTRFRCQSRSPTWFAATCTPRPNMMTASNQVSTWLSGYRPGQPLHSSCLMRKLRDSGIHLLGARNAALRELVLEMPPPIVADALGYSAQVTEKHAEDAGRTWVTTPLTDRAEDRSAASQIRSSGEHILVPATGDQEPRMGSLLQPIRDLLRALGRAPGPQLL